MVTHDHGSAIQTWIALDIAKDYNAVLIELPGGKRSSFRMANHRQDHDRLVDYVRSLPQPCRFGFEATGNYHRPLAYRLLRESFEVCLISSVTYGLVKRQQPYQGHYEHALPSGSIPLCRAVEAKPTS